MATVTISKQELRIAILDVSEAIATRARHWGFMAAIVPSKSYGMGDWMSPTRYVHIHGDGGMWKVRVSDHEKDERANRRYGRDDLEIVLPRSQAYIDLTVDSFFRWISQQGE